MRSADGESDRGFIEVRRAGGCNRHKAQPAAQPRRRLDSVGHEKNANAERSHARC